jgi:hypothetical protein
VTTEGRVTSEVIPSPTITTSVGLVPRKSIMVNGKRIEKPYVASCIMCNSDYGIAVEALRAYGNSYKTIMGMIPETDRLVLSRDGKPISLNHFTNRVSTHMKKHGVFEKAVTTQIVDRYAEQQGLDVTNAVDTLLTIPGHLHAIMQRGHEGLVDGGKVSIGDSIAAARALADFEMKRYSEEVGVGLFIGVFEQVVVELGALLEDDDLRVIMRRFQSNPTIADGMAMIRARQQALAIEASGVAS